jgi:hypothetical protein
MCYGVPENYLGREDKTAWDLVDPIWVEGVLAAIATLFLVK